jgi:molybdopterin/thiamine biosynthesis adenylyltransferase
MLEFTPEDITRYSRNILLAEVGGSGQATLCAARVLVVGAGGLGCPLALYLAAVGVGTIGVVDDDTVDLSNLQRQIAHTTGRIGAPKVQSLAASIAALNPGTRLELHGMRLTAANVTDLIAGYDLVCDGSDNASTRYLLNDACVLAGKTLISAAVLRFDGQLSTFKPGGPCYRCLFPVEAAPGTLPTCAQAGVMGPVTGVMGSLQAAEVVKEILGIGEGLSGRLLVWDALGARFETIRLPKDPACPACGEHPTIHDLSAHE